MAADYRKRDARNAEVLKQLRLLKMKRYFTYRREGEYFVQDKKTFKTHGPFESWSSAKRWVAEQPDE